MPMQHVQRIGGIRIARSGYGRAENPVRVWGLVAAAGYRDRPESIRPPHALPGEKR